MADEDKPEHIKKFDELSEKVRKIIDTTDLKHSEAYIQAAKEHLTDEDGNIDYDRFSDMNIRDDFADHMADTYIKAAKEHFDVKSDSGDQVTEDRLMKAYTNFTRGQIKDVVRRRGKSFTRKYFQNEFAPRFMEQLESELNSSARSHLKKEHIDDLIKHAHPDASKYFVSDNIDSPDEAAQIYRTIKDNKAITKPLLEQFSHKSVLSDAAKNEYELTKTYKDAA